VSLLDIRVFGDPVLRKQTTIVTAVSDDIRRLSDDMFETMYGAKGIGLAAPQVGRLERVCVVDVDGARYTLVNPEIVHQEGTAKGEEGCLSIPDIYADVERAAIVKVRALDLNGEPFELEGTELLGRCLQHEIDHLHGRLFVDKLSMLKKRSAAQKWEKLKANYPGFIRKVVPGEFDDDKEDTL
jgi:peptide deformylase